jgi:hypothetical protein
MYWIEAEPSSIRLFVDFVQGDGYSRPDLWPVKRTPEVVSVDDRCDRVRDASSAGDHAWVRGLTWPEAYAIAAFTNARLPFEVEWEIAFAGNTRLILSDGLEWTADVFSPVYWRADFSTRGNARLDVLPGEKRSARGFLDEDLVRDVSVRRGLNPDLPLFPCGLRRVWDKLPPEAEVVAANPD